MQSNNTNNDGNIDFSQGNFLGLTNPLVFQGLTNSWNVSCLAWVYYYFMIIIKYHYRLGKFCDGNRTVKCLGIIMIINLAYLNLTGNPTRYYSQR